MHSVSCNVWMGGSPGQQTRWHAGVPLQQAIRPVSFLAAVISAMADVLQMRFSNSNTIYLCPDLPKKQCFNAFGHVKLKS